MRAVSRRFFDCSLDESEDFFRLVRVSGETYTVSGDRVNDSSLPFESFNRASRTLGRAVKNFNRAPQTLGQVVKTFNRASQVSERVVKNFNPASINSNRAVNLFNRPVKSFGGSVQTSNRVPYNF
jgi:hypothetical protein